jgi:hypothetical protein
MALKEVTAQPRAREAAPRGVAMNVSESSSISETVQDISWYKVIEEVTPCACEQLMAATSTSHRR